MASMFVLLGRSSSPPPPTCPIWFQVSFNICCVLQISTEGIPVNTLYIICAVQLRVRNTNEAHLYSWGCSVKLRESSMHLRLCSKFEGHFLDTWVIFSTEFFHDDFKYTNCLTAKTASFGQNYEFSWFLRFSESRSNCIFRNFKNSHGKFEINSSDKFMPRIAEFRTQAERFSAITQTSTLSIISYRPKREEILYKLNTNTFPFTRHWKSELVIHTVLMTLSTFSLNWKIVVPWYNQTKFLTVWSQTQN